MIVTVDHSPWDNNNNDHQVSLGSPHKVRALAEDDGTASLSTSSSSCCSTPLTTKLRTVRFGLEHNQFHEAPPPPQPWIDNNYCRKQVSFCLDDNEVLESSWTDADLVSSWYDASQIAKWEQQQQQQQSTDLFSKTTSTLQDIYRQCVSSCTTEKHVRRIRQRPGIDRSALIELYQMDRHDNTSSNEDDSDTLVGREQVSPDIRGGTVSALIQFMLVQGMMTSMMNHTCALDSVALAHVSLCVSRPARVYAQETALALHHVLSSTEEDSEEKDAK